MPTQRADASSRDFRQALSAFEDEVLNPVVPGEVRGWCRTVQRLVDPLREQWRRSQAEHKQVTEQILEDDPELSRRVDHLEEREAEIASELDRLRARLDALVRAEDGESNGSWEPMQETGDVRKALERWIMACREQEHELRTWMVESVYRDRGTGD